ncbi:MAG: murein biosynthesis integral membrane protein MurJ [Deltaproteobacteria bacterium]|nr:murein biosynthesis integral membrane protein MurJ [Deltaproteobacteria bacterium]MBT4268084.1 murein biosynthesis integral membrane protein MurJ [Deltaproteobacteria bacterium]MBT4641448.1 murein biosynthesis integral membrane protein MurJ [Deltaproteobacteria bacterium]MBT6500063.1 murein biosynthesis integral membrane protein MurJ [Deltaproteobacteria bacterium]MBT7152922.1 murein biosynthesis integral membrane protein MurJ [Deltaproteobacteria bacterium]
MNQPIRSKNKALFKSIGLVSLITLFSRILGLMREIVKAALLGTSYHSDAFTLAFTIPNLFRRMTAEGAMSSAFIPVFNEILHQDGEKRAFDFAKNFFWLFTFALVLFSLLFILSAPWLIRYVFAPGFDGEPLHLTVILTQYMFIYILFISLAAILQGVLNSFAIFWISSLTPVLLNISIIACALFFAPRLSNPTFGFAIGVLLGGVIQLTVQLPTARKTGLQLLSRINLADPKIRQVITLILPTIFGTGIYQINIIVSNFIASSLDEGAISSLNFSNRLLELIIGVFIISITTVFLPRFSTLFAEQRLDTISSEMQRIIEITAFIALPATVGIFMIGDEIVTLLFARGAFDATSVSLTAGALRYHILGLIFISWNRILLTLFQAGKWIRHTVQIAAVILIVNTVAALVFSRTTGHLGIAGANSLSQVVQTVLLVLYLHKLMKCRIGLFFSGKRLAKTVMLSTLLLIALWGFKTYIIAREQPVLLNVCLLIGFGIIFYGSCALLFKSEALKSLIEQTRFHKRS